MSDIVLTVDTGITVQLDVTASSTSACPVGTVENSNGTYSDTVASGETLVLPDTTLLNSDGDTLSTNPSVQNITAPDATVQNQDGDYTADIPSGDTLTLPFQTVIDSDGSSVDVDYLPKTDGIAFTASACKDLADYTNQELEDGLSEAQRNALTRVSLFKSGTPAVTYYANDAGANNPGRGTDFFTLPVNNPNGNTNRFEVLGTDVVIDWAYRKYWTRYIQSPTRTLWETVGATIGHNDAAAALTLEGLSTWRLPLIMEYLTIMNTFDGDPLDYSPFNIANGTTPGANFAFATGETSIKSTANYWYIFLESASRGYGFGAWNKLTNGAVALYCKDF